MSMTVESLESRSLLSATVVGAPAVVNVSRAPGDQSEEAIAANPANPQQVFLASNEIDGNSGTSAARAGLFTATSNDGGSTWATHIIATGSHGLPVACCDPSVAWDAYGNLFLAYLRSDTNHAELLMSTDSGATFTEVRQFPGTGDQPTVIAGHGSVWVAFQQDPQSAAPGAARGQGAVVYGAKVFGAGSVGPFNSAQGISRTEANVGDIAVGPAGQVAVVYQPDVAGSATTLLTRTDLDGLGHAKFGGVNSQVTDAIGPFYPIPAQSNRTIDAEAGLAYDMSSGPFAGRLYMVYTSVAVSGSADTNISLRYSDDNGTTWSAPVRVNDDTGAASQFFPRISVDPASGAVGITWYDARNDTGNSEVQVYGAVGTPTATDVQFSPNFVVQPGFSSAAAPGFDANQFGDYNGQAFLAGVLRPAWADNSNTTGDNPDGQLHTLDVYSAAINVQTAPDSIGTLLGEFGDVGGKLTYSADNGSRVTLAMRHGYGVAWKDPAGDLSLRVIPTDARSAVIVSVRGGGVTLGNIVVVGNLGSFVAPQADLAGTFSVSGSSSRITLGTISGGTFSSVGPVGTLVASSLTNAKILAGANLGPDNALGGGDDTFAAGSIDTITIRGAIQGSFIGAGVDPVNGILGDADDQIIGGAASQIRRLRARSLDATSRIEAGAFGQVFAPGAVDPAADPRFKVG